MPTKRLLKVARLLPFLAWGGTLFAETPIITVDELHPGMRGVGKTVFSGTKIEEFGVEIVDVVRNYYPKQDIVLVRLDGAAIEKTGVAGGMSGSPVYVDGKLLGAVAYRFGLFAKEPLAGVMPIEQMLPIVNQQQKRPSLWGRDGTIANTFLPVALGVQRKDPFLTLAPQQSHEASQGLSPWPQLMLLSGFSEQVARWATPILSAQGFEIAYGGGGGHAVQPEQVDDLLPGSPVALVLVDGDASIQVVGTVTWRDGNQLLAFGHPIFNAGPTAFPIGRVRIVTTIPSLMASEKFPVLTDLAGTFHQGRLSGSYGELGSLPRLTPMVITCTGADVTPSTFHFRAALDPSLKTMVPFYLRIAMVNAIESARRSGGDYSLQLRGEIRLNANRVVRINNFYARGETPGFLSPMEDVLRSTMEVASTIATLLFNPFHQVEIDSIRLGVEVFPVSRRATVMRVWHDRAEVQAGDSVTTVVTLLTNQGKWETVRYSFSVPKTVQPNSRLSVTVGGATELTRFEASRFPHRFRPQSFNQLIHLLNKRRQNDHLYVQVRVNDTGVALAGQEMPSLPPSMLGILNARRSSGVVNPLRYKVLSEKAIPLGFEVSGSKTITLKVTDGTHGR